MSILIKGIEMPKEGELLCINIHPNGKVCIGLNINCDKIATAVTVPKHGRLIDADALKFTPSEFWGFQAADNAKSAEAIVNDAPTIIPAEQATKKNGGQDDV